MADITITEAQVVQTTDRSKLRTYVAGAEISPGEAVYLKSSDHKVWPAIDTSAAAAAAIGIAVSAAEVAENSIVVQEGGTITLGAGASVTAGMILVVGAAAGGMSAIADLATGEYVTIMGVCNGSNQLVMPAKGPFASGVSHA